jgi:hypothetical protein
MDQVFDLKALTSPWTPILVAGSNAGAAVDIPNLGAIGVPLPASAWWVFVWILVISIEFDTGALLSVTSGTNQPLNFKWSSSGYAFYLQGSAEFGESIARPNNQWFMVTMGTDSSGNTGGKIRLKGNTSYMRYFGANVQLVSPAAVRAPVGTGNFNVSNM